MHEMTSVIERTGRLGNYLNRLIKLLRVCVFNARPDLLRHLKESPPGQLSINGSFGLDGHSSFGELYLQKVPFFNPQGRPQLFGDGDLSIQGVRFLSGFSGSPRKSVLEIKLSPHFHTIGDKEIAFVFGKNIESHENP
jgi:hypothetical protein